jgi:hypothetical protein
VKSVLQNSPAADLSKLSQHRGGGRQNWEIVPMDSRQSILWRKPQTIDDFFRSG